jgi:hypothetical protein
MDNNMQGQLVFVVVLGQKNDQWLVSRNVGGKNRAENMFL